MANLTASKTTVDDITENLLNVIPVLTKKLMRANPSRLSQNIRLSHLHVMIMGSLQKHKKMRASELGRDFMILKPQMTRLIKELVDAGLVEQIPDVNDRRAKYIVLTGDGKLALRKFLKLLKKNLAGQLSHLSCTELKEFSLLMTRLKHIGSILEKYGR